MNEEHEIKIQSITRFYILLLLKSRKKITGYKILKALEKDLGTTASPTSVYDFLKDLKRKEYVKDLSKLENERSKGFELTQPGEDFVNRIFSRFNNLVEAAIQSKLYVCASCGVRLYEDFHTETIDGKNLNFCCKHCAKAYRATLH
ncbi:MAG: helix-turn-helix transcriptional regulator [Promethearchaeota archaeon]|jgi:DNA-binding PadR family transcriptional regulator